MRVGNLMNAGDQKNQTEKYSADQSEIGGVPHGGSLHDSARMVFNVVVLPVLRVEEQPSCTLYRVRLIFRGAHDERPGNLHVQGLRGIAPTTAASPGRRCGRPADTACRVSGAASSRA